MELFNRTPLRLTVCAAALAIPLIASVAVADSEPTLPEGPDFKAVIDLPSISDPQISPDGTAIAYVGDRTDWDENRFDSEIWLARQGEEPFQLTRTEDSSSSSPRWSPDGRWIAFFADRGNDTQIYLIRAAGGEAQPLTAVKGGVSNFEWSPDGSQMAVRITDRKDKHREKIEKTYGKFAIEDDEHRMSHLWILDVEAARKTDAGAELPADEPDKESDGDAEEGSAEKGDDEGNSDNSEEVSEDRDAEDTEDEADEPSALRRLTSGSKYTVTGYRWSPDGQQIAFVHTTDPRVESFSHADLSVVDVATGKTRRLVEQPAADNNPHWSPDGRWIVFSTQNGKFPYYYNTELAKVPADGGEPTLLTADFDENPTIVGWFEDGIRFLALDGTHRRLYRLSADGGDVEPLLTTPERIWNVTTADNGRTMAIGGANADTLGEIWRLESASSEPELITHMTEATNDWQVGTRELIRWPSQDGASIEGVLLKPDNFDPEKKHPLLVIIHGGPAWLSFPQRVYSYVYPVQQWLAKGAVILMPNYRGSAGYGEAFRSLNVRNLGVGDAWDVLSGVDHLIELGFVDPERMGAMGWSQGGYISMFLTTTSDRFQAISAGAGISNWMTYYVNTDIHPFTRHYLEGTPWDDPEVYAKTSPMTYVEQAKTPTLIQHGEFDRRVPVPNAYELFQGLQDVGVETRLIIYKGFGHGIGKPKERLAAVWHNWQWFARYLWGEEVNLDVD